jgi:UDP-glucose 4-epimerase
VTKKSIEKILVTGGAGFVGSKLIKKLRTNEKYEIYSLDNYFIGKKENHVPGVSYIEGDCKDIESLIDFKPDVLFHFGEYSRISTSFSEVERVWEYNINGTFQVLNFCKKNNIKLIYSASSTKFGDGGKNKNESPYALFKSQNVDLINCFSSWFDIDYAICYFYNVYGPGQIRKGKYATIIGIFEEQYKNQEPLTVVSPGTQKRDFTHIDDVIHGLILLMKKGYGDGYCFGTGKSYEINEIANMFKSDIKYIPERKGERSNSSIDFTKSLELGWKPRKKIENYINKIKE